MKAVANLVCGIADKRLGNIHHSVIIGECLIKFNTGELGIVTNIHTLVAEVSADFIDTLHTADDKTL